MKNNADIFVDLDETLINSLYGKGRNPGRRTVVRFDEGGDSYHSLLRPAAYKMLKELRSFGKVMMLTTATRDYAVAHNDVFELGFEEKDIELDRILEQSQSAALESLSCDPPRINPEVVEGTANEQDLVLRAGVSGSEDIRTDSGALGPCDRVFDGNASSGQALGKWSMVFQRSSVIWSSLGRLDF